MPKDVETRIARALVDLLWRADLHPAHSTVGAIVNQDPSAAPIFAAVWLDLALCERDPSAAGQALAALSDNTYGPDAMAFTHAFAEGFVARVRGDTAAAQIAFKAARAEQEQIVREQPNYAPAVCVLGVIDAALGRKEEALQEGRRAIELLPVAEDTISGSDMIMFFAVICAWSGEKDLALAQLKILPLTPLYVTYGYLRLHPWWDPLRGDPRFEQIVASLAPKPADK